MSYTLDDASVFEPYVGQMTEALLDVLSSDVLRGEGRGGTDRVRLELVNDDGSRRERFVDVAPVGEAGADGHVSVRISGAVQTLHGLESRGARRIPVRERIGVDDLVRQASIDFMSL